jgi:hypothetical protein
VFGQEVNSAKLRMIKIIFFIASNFEKLLHKKQLFKDILNLSESDSFEGFAILLVGGEIKKSRQNRNVN